MNSKDRLISKLKTDLGLQLPDDIEIRQTHAGYWQRRQGALSWFLYSPTESSWCNFGSASPVSRLLVAKKLVMEKSRISGTIEIFEN